MAGQPAGLATAYDRYAPGLYAYCWSLLADPAEAAGAVQDTFIIVAAKAGGLRDRERFRPWLYAVARNECFGRLRAQGLSAPLDETGELAVGAPDPAAGPQRRELRALVVAALAGLSPRDREVIELNLRHVLDGQDLADVLGVSRNQAYALLSRARDQFEGSLGALLVASDSRRACRDLEDILGDWDGNLTILLRKRVNRHAAACEVCGERQSRELSPAMLLSMLPMVALPAGLRDQVFRVVTDGSPGGIGYRDLVARRAEPFDRSGFPETIEPPGRLYGVRTLSAVTSVAVIAAVLLGAGDRRHAGRAAPQERRAGELGGHRPDHGPSAPGVRLRPGTDATARHHSGSKGGAPVTVAQPSPSPSPAPRQPQSVPSPAGHSAPSSPNPPPRSHSHSPPPPTSPPPTPGSLVASPGAVTLISSGGTYTGEFTITAQGGAVSGYSIVDPAPAGDLSISPSSGGTIQAGQSVTITVSVASTEGLAFETDLSVDPGNLTVIVDYPPSG